MQLQTENLVCPRKVARELEWKVGGESILEQIKHANYIVATVGI